MLKNVSPSDLVPFDIFLDKEPIKLDLVYADQNHPSNIFNESIYHSTARTWGHKDMAAIAILTARTLNKQAGYTLEIKDCLRTINSQKAMQETQIVKLHPEWSDGGQNHYLALPGQGGHPRAMAIDVCVLDQEDKEVDMGTPFDHMGKESARNYKDLSPEILQNRQILENAFLKSAKTLSFPFIPLPSEWWDFRFPASYNTQYHPLSDSDLPPQMQMTNKIKNNIPDFDEKHFQNLAEAIINLIDKHDGSL